MDGISKDLLWWITVVDLPALSGLLLMVWKVRGINEKEVDALQMTLERRCEQLRDALAAFKLEVAKTYAAQKDVRAFEERLVEHLLRIESKLDKTALKTAELNGRKN
ncbi:MAG: hypothetical protein ACRBDI_03380 [Alphaproteobacteria bacterium]